MVREQHDSSCPDVAAAKLSLAACSGSAGAASNQIKGMDSGRGWNHACKMQGMIIVMQAALGPAWWRITSVGGFPSLGQLLFPVL